jgi:hypothetical protein
MGQPSACNRTESDVTADLYSAFYRPLADYRVLRLNDGRVELAYTAHEWMREMT